MQPTFYEFVNPHVDWLAQVSAASGDVDNLNPHGLDAIDNITHLMHTIGIKYDNGLLHGWTICIMSCLSWLQNNINPLMHLCLVHHAFSWQAYFPASEYNMNSHIVIHPGYWRLKIRNDVNIFSLVETVASSVTCFVLLVDDLA